MKQRPSKPAFPQILKGAAVDAIYSPPQIRDYAGNPTIEALPPIRDKVRAIELLSLYPEHSEEDRQLPTLLRRHLLGRAKRFCQPLAIHGEIFERFDVLLRQGLMPRNHFDVRERFEMRKRLERTDPTDPYALAMLEAQDPAKVNKDYSGGLGIIGLPGVGKTYLMERVLSLYPQVIFHSEYRGQEFPLQQIVWLRLVCPPDGSIKALCLGFFDAIDQILDTAYFHAYSSLTVDQMLQRIRKLSFEHAIGVLVIDEIQDLSEAKSGGAQRMLNFFVNLENIGHMPVILIGTLKAKPLLTREFRHARRNASEGDVVWLNMHNDDNWRCFTEALWVYQYVRNPSPWTEELSDTLYDVSQGIADFAVKMFCASQVRAMRTGVEAITPSIIKSVARDRFVLAKPVLDALRKRDFEALEAFPDVSIDFSQLMDQEAVLPATRVTSNAGMRPTKSAVDSTHNETNDGSAPDTADYQVTDGGIPKPMTQPPVNRKPRSTKAIPPPTSLPHGLSQTISTGLSQQKAAYQSLKEAGYLRAADEFISNLH